ncbi:MAG: T9SS type A sorting domain-containing protein [Crocinitomicaceae bacterium]|nr:T9SS type A sorting domain-containing protein [Crocinitomicaceae bacterium]
MNDDYAPCVTSSELNVATAGYDSLYVIVEGWGSEMGSYTLTIGEGILGTNELVNDSFSIYPNPSQTSFQLGGNYSGNVTILNTEGKVVFNQNIDLKEEVEISFLSSGLYIVRLQSDTQVYDKKLIIE